MTSMNRVNSFELASVNVALIAEDTWTVIDPDGCIDPCIFFRISNMSGNIVFISLDGINQHDVVMPWNTIKLNLQTNAAPKSEVCKISKYKKFYVQGDPDPKGGRIYLAGYY